MIRIIPHTAVIAFNDSFTPELLIDKFYEQLSNQEAVLHNEIQSRDTKAIELTTKAIDHLCMLINSTMNYCEPISFEFCKDKIMEICDFQKPYFDHIGIKYQELPIKKD
jgi:hypothetical protein